MAEEDLKREIPFDELLNRHRDTIGAQFLSDSWEFPVLSGEELYFPFVVEAEVDILEAEYIGHGKWKVEGAARWETEVEYFDPDEPPLNAEKSVMVLMDIVFTVYYDYKDKGSDHETIIQYVTSGYSVDYDPEEYYDEGIEPIEYYQEPEPDDNILGPMEKP